MNNNSDYNDNNDDIDSENSDNESTINEEITNEMSIIISGSDDLNIFETNNHFKNDITIINYDSSLSLRKNIKDIIQFWNIDIDKYQLSDNDSVSNLAQISKDAEILVKNMDDFNQLPIMENDTYIYCLFSDMSNDVVPKLNILLVFYLFEKNKEKQACVTFYLHDGYNASSLSSSYFDVLKKIFDIYDLSKMFLYKLKNNTLFNFYSTSYIMPNDISSIFNVNGNIVSNDMDMLPSYILETFNMNTTDFNTFLISKKDINDICNKSINIDTNNVNNINNTKEKYNNYGFDSDNAYGGNNNNNNLLKEINGNIDSVVYLFNNINSDDNKTLVYDINDNNETNKDITNNFREYTKNLLLENISIFKNKSINELINVIVDNNIEIINDFSNNINKDDDIISRIGDNTNNIYVFHKDIELDNNIQKQRFITGIIIYDILDNYVLIKYMYVLFANDIAFNMAKILDLFKCLFDKYYPNVNDFYLYAVNSSYSNILINPFNGFKKATIEEINMIEDKCLSMYKEKIYKINESYDILKFSRNPLPNITMNDPSLDSKNLPSKYAIIDYNNIVIISSTILIEGQNVDTISVSDYLNSNTDNFVFMLDNIYYGLNKDNVKTILFQNNSDSTPNYNKLFYECGDSFYINQNNIYISLQDFGINKDGFVFLNDILKILNINSFFFDSSIYYDRIYNLNDTQKKLNSVIGLLTIHSTCPDYNNMKCIQNNNILYNIELIRYSLKEKNNNISPSSSQNLNEGMMIDRQNKISDLKSNNIMTLKNNNSIIGGSGSDHFFIKKYSKTFKKNNKHYIKRKKY